MARQERATTDEIQDGVAILRYPLTSCSFHQGKDCCRRAGRCNHVESMEDCSYYRANENKVVAMDRSPFKEALEILINTFAETGIMAGQGQDASEIQGAICVLRKPLINCLHYIGWNNTCNTKPIGGTSGRYPCGHAEDFQQCPLYKPPQEEACVAFERASYQKAIDVIIGTLIEKEVILNVPRTLSSRNIKRLFNKYDFLNEEN